MLSFLIYAPNPKYHSPEQCIKFTLFLPKQCILNYTQTWNSKLF